MSIFKRVKDIIVSNINDMIDKFEDPESMINQMIREMEESIADLRKQTAEGMAAAKLTERKLISTRADEAKWQKNAELAITKGDDDLAREALSRKRKSSEQISYLEKQVNDEDTMVERMKSDLQLVEEKVQEARRKRETLLMKKRAADAKKKMAESSEKARQNFDNSAGSIINGFDSFSRFEEKIEKELAEAEAREELSRDLQKPDLDRKFAQLEEKDEVDDELAALKAKMKGKK